MREKTQEFEQKLRKTDQDKSRAEVESRRAAQVIESDWQRKFQEL
jgi:hypothetical protein